MTQTTLITERQTAFTSTTVSIPAGAEYVFGLYTTGAAAIPANAFADIVAVTPGGTRQLYELTGNGVPQGVRGPVDVKVNLPDLTAFGVNVGVFYNS